LGEAQVSKIAPRAICIWMFGAEYLLEDRQRALKQWPSAVKVALSLKEKGKIIEANRGVSVLGAERSLADRQSPLLERARASEIPLGLKQNGEIAGFVAVKGCSLPSAFSVIARARS
jgi:hypothetical protein